MWLRWNCPAHFTVTVEGVSLSFKGGDWGFEVASIRQAIGADGAAAREGEFLPVILANEAAAGAFQDFNSIDQPARDDAISCGCKSITPSSVQKRSSPACGTTNSSESAE